MTFDKWGVKIFPWLPRTMSWRVCSMRVGNVAIVNVVSSYCSSLLLKPPQIGPNRHDIRPKSKSAHDDPFVLCLCSWFSDGFNSIILTNQLSTMVALSPAVRKVPGSNPPPGRHFWRLAKRRKTARQHDNRCRVQYGIFPNVVIDSLRPVTNKEASCSNSIKRRCIKRPF